MMNKRKRTWGVVVRVVILAFVGILTIAMLLADCGVSKATISHLWTSFETSKTVTMIANQKLIESSSNLNSTEWSELVNNYHIRKIFCENHQCEFIYNNKLQTIDFLLDVTLLATANENGELVIKLDPILKRKDELIGESLASVFCDTIERINIRLSHSVE